MAEVDVLLTDAGGNGLIPFIPDATETRSGLVRPDGNTLTTNAQGTLSAAIADTNQLGIVRPGDGFIATPDGKLNTYEYAAGGQLGSRSTSVIADAVCECSNSRVDVALCDADQMGITGTVAYDCTLKVSKTLDASKTTGTIDSSSSCNYVIVDGKLFYMYSGSLAQVGSLSDWTAVCGCGEDNNYAYGICDSKLYAIHGTNATLLGSGSYYETGWTYLSSTAPTNNNSYIYSYGICNGTLYALNRDSVEILSTQPEPISDHTIGTVDSSLPSTFYIYNGKLYYQFEQMTSKQLGIGTDYETGWTEVTGYSYLFYQYAYGICNGKLYAINSDTITQLGSGTEYETGWYTVTGYSESNYYAYGICQGALYALSQTAVTRVGSDADWIIISGYSSYSEYAYGIRSGKLYQLNRTTATQVGSLTGWTHIAGWCSSGSNYALGICNGALYRVNRTTATQIGSGTDYETGWTAVSGHSDSSTICYAYGICNGKLYSFYSNTVLQVGSGTDYETGWTMISGYSSVQGSSIYQYAYGICNGKLFALHEASIDQIGSHADWLYIAGFSTGVKQSVNSKTYFAYGCRESNPGGIYTLSGTMAIRLGPMSNQNTQLSGYSNTSEVQCAFAIYNGKLYKLYSTNTPVQVGSDSTWTCVSGTSKSDDGVLGYGIRGGVLYKIAYSGTLTQVGTDADWATVTGQYSTSTYASFIAYGLKIDGTLYKISSTSATAISSVPKMLKVVGYSSSYDNVAYAISVTGDVYALYGSGSVYATGISGATDIWGSSYAKTRFAYVLANGQLYSLAYQSSATPAFMQRNVSLSSLATVIDGQQEMAKACIEHTIVNSGDLQKSDTIRYHIASTTSTSLSINAPYYIIDQGESAVDQYRWRKWSDGILEQWIFSPATSAKYRTVPFPLSYSSSYVDGIFVLEGEDGTTATGTATGGYDYCTYISNVTYNSLRLNIPANRACTLYIYGRYV